MDSTTLVTFRCQTKPEVRSVELFGSWDNFNRSYVMQRDAQRGRGLWTGCHSFENIICDGDRIDHSRPRNGALKQGGTYWYYYKLDDQEEACDSVNPTTASCPLLPGQLVNVYDVPMEVVEPPQRVCSASDSLSTLMETTMTINPADRYRKVHRKPPTKLPRYYCSSDALRERFNAGYGKPPAYNFESPRLRDRAHSPGARSTKRMRCEEPSFQKPGACRIDVTAEDMALLANSPDELDAQEKEMPVLRPFAPCSQTSMDDRPVTRGGFINSTPGLDFSSFSSNKQSTKKAHRLSEDITMEFKYASQQMPQYDGAFEEPEVANSDWPLSPPMPTVADNGNWPLPRRNPLKSHPTLVLSAANTPTSAIPTLDLQNQFQPPAYLQSYPSPSLTTSSTSEDYYHPGFGPNNNNGLYDMTSPTFTAETASSSPGIRTPDRFRLSLDPTSTITTLNNQTTTEDFKTGLEDLSRRLADLTSSESEYESDSDNESLFQPTKQTEFYTFGAVLTHNDDEEDQYQDSNASCLTLKPGSSSMHRKLETGHRELSSSSSFTLSLPGTAGSGCGSGIAAEFSSDVFGALGIEV